MSIDLSPVVRPAFTLDPIDVGEETFSRRLVTSNQAATTTQILRLSYFTARKTETTTAVRVLSGATAAGATPTLIRVGLYTVSAVGDLTLVASTPNDTALFASPSTAYTKAFSASYAKVAGQRYAVGVLVVTAATAPTLLGSAALSGGEPSVAPVIAGLVTGQSDLPSPVAAGSVLTNGQLHYVALLP